MTIFRHEMKIGKKAWIIWTVSLAAFMLMCVCFYPSMSGEMETVSKLFSTMGFFSAAFGMDKVDFGSLTGFYAIECGNVIGIGGAMYAAITAVSMLAKEEQGHTAEFLYAHPLSRTRIALEKLLAAVLQVTLMNLVVMAVSFISILLIGETIPMTELTLMHIAYLICQLEIVLLSFGLSAFFRGNAYGVGLGLALLMYFLNTIANVSKDLKIFQKISSFGYTNAADILVHNRLDLPLIAAALCVSAIVTIIGILYYRQKDLFC